MKDACRRALAHQMSKAWVLGSGRLEKAVGDTEAGKIMEELQINLEVIGQRFHLRALYNRL